MSNKSYPAAFNGGCDGRLNGLPLSACPYRTTGSTEERRRYEAWREGWRDVDEHWGRYVRGRWDVTALPAIGLAARREAS